MATQYINDLDLLIRFLNHKYNTVVFEDALKSTRRYLFIYPFNQQLVRYFFMGKNYIMTELSFYGISYDHREYLKECLEKNTNYFGKIITEIGIECRKKSIFIREEMMIFFMTICYQKWQKSNLTFDVFMKNILGDNVRINDLEPETTDKWDFLHDQFKIKWIIPRWISDSMVSYIEHGNGKVVPTILWQLLFGNMKKIPVNDLNKSIKNCISMWNETIAYIISEINYYKMTSDLFKPFMDTLIEMKVNEIFTSDMLRIHRTNFHYSIPSEVALYLEQKGLPECVK